MKLVKMLGRSEVFVNALTKLIDASFDSGVFPSSWKSAKVVPVFKSGDPSDVDNYRPISVLNCLSKIIERVAFNHIYAFLIKENLLHILQSGFRHRHSTCTALDHLIDKVYNDMDNCKLTGGLFLDLRKAFDTVNHDIMLKEFARFNPSRKMTQWLLCYLSCRSRPLTTMGLCLMQLPFILEFLKDPFWDHCCFLYMSMICRQISAPKYLPVPVSSSNNERCHYRGELKRFRIKSANSLRD